MWVEDAECGPALSGLGWYGDIWPVRYWGEMNRPDSSYTGVIGSASDMGGGRWSGRLRCMGRAGVVLAS